VYDNNLNTENDEFNNTNLLDFSDLTYLTNRSLNYFKNTTIFNNKKSKKLNFFENPYLKLKNPTILTNNNNINYQNLDGMRSQILNNKYYSKYLKRKFSKRFFLILN